MDRVSNAVSMQPIDLEAERARRLTGSQMANNGQVPAGYGIKVRGAHYRFGLRPRATRTSTRNRPLSDPVRFIGLDEFIDALLYLPNALWRLPRHSRKKRDSHGFQPT